MRKLFALLFAVGLLATGFLVPSASASQSSHSCTGLAMASDHSAGANYDPGQAWRACAA